LKAAIDLTVMVPTTIGGGRPNPLLSELREVLLRMRRGRRRTCACAFLDPDRDHSRREAMLAEYGLSGRELADGVVLMRAGQGSKLRKAHVLPGRPGDLRDRSGCAA
jgi:hypothetical protein